MSSTTKSTPAAGGIPSPGGNPAVAKNASSSVPGAMQSKPSSPQIITLSQKTIAIGSGKGGVGKTTTAVNLGLHYARNGLRTGLIDADPLSDIATLLDITGSDEALLSGDFQTDADDFDAYRIRLFRNFDLIFPQLKLRKKDSAKLFELVFRKHRRDIEKDYDLVLIDLPAGMFYDDNLVFIREIPNLVVVTNAEPSAHVAAGGYIKLASSLRPDLNISLWHNKFPDAPDPDFDPTDVLGNYNRNVAEEDRVDPSMFTVRMKDIALIPADAAMDLLQGNPSVPINVCQSLLELVRLFQENLLEDKIRSVDVSEATRQSIKSFFAPRTDFRDPPKILSDLKEYLLEMIARRLGKGDSPVPLDFSSRQMEALRKLVDRLSRDKFYLFLFRAARLLRKEIQSERNSQRLFSAKVSESGKKDIDRELSRLLMILSKVRDKLDPFKRNTAGLILYYFSLFKLFQSKTVSDVVGSFIPTKRDAKNRRIRDKHAQIRNLVEKNEAYRRQFLQLVKILVPLVNRQLQAVVETFSLENLLFREADGKVLKHAYVKLLSNFIHDTVNSGLGIIVGFEHRPAAVGFRKAADDLLRGVLRTRS